MNESAQLSEVCSVICQTIASTHRQQPELFTQKYRSLLWQNASHQTALSKKMMERFCSVTAASDLMREIEQFLRILLVPAFFESHHFKALIAQIHPLVSPALTAQTNDLPDPAQPSSLNGKKPEPSIAILLLDAENLQLDAEAEKFLTSNCKHSLQVKIAFANWRTLGKYDAELHSRGYDLIHVPAGDDMADGKMIAVGSSVLEHYRSVKEVFVCSSDKVMTNLCTKLRQQGLVVYQVRKQNDVVSLKNGETGETTVYSKNPLPEVLSLEKCMARIKELISSEQKQMSSPWIKLSRVSQLFQANTGFSISQVMAIHQPNKRARDLFIENPVDFVVYQPPEQSELYITLFEMPASTPQVQAVPAATAPAQISKINTRAELEQALIKLMKELAVGAPGGYVNIGRLSAQFRAFHQQSITTVLKQLNLNQKYPAFLKSCTALKVQQKGNLWEVAMRSK